VLGGHTESPVAGPRGCERLRAVNCERRLAARCLAAAAGTAFVSGAVEPTSPQGQLGPETLDCRGTNCPHMFWAVSPRRATAWIRSFADGALNGVQL
jgi:hypothetical protein